MSTIPSKNQKIINENTDLIHLVINAVHFSSYVPGLNNNLALAKENGWDNLVSAIKKIISGERNIDTFLNLDLEDQAIISEIISNLSAPNILAKFFLQQGILQFSQGNITQSELACKKACEIAPQFPDAAFQLAYVYQSQKKYNKAKAVYEKALEQAPNNPMAHLNLGVILQEQKHFDSACTHFDRALKIKPSLVAAMEHLAYLHEKAYKLQDAQLLVDEGLKLNPQSSALNLVQSKLLQRKKQFKDAATFLKIALDSNKIPSLNGEIHARLGYLYDRLEQPNLAYEHYSTGNQLANEQFLQQGIDKEPYLKQVDRIAVIAEKYAPKQQYKSTQKNIGKDPVFLVGFPRSGTTLMNQILDSHPKIQALEEKPQVYEIVTKFLQLTDKQQNPLMDISNESISTLRNMYFETVNKYIERKSDLLFIDKFPLNIAYVPIISRVFPEAKFIFALRHPSDACLSCFMHSFGLNTAMANFLTMQDTVDLYAKLMGNWELYSEKYNLKIHRIKYEDLITDFKNETQKILTFLDLDWDDEVSKHTDKARLRGVINTPSYDQVTEPLYNHAIYRWTRYREQLKPYTATLEPYINMYSY